MVTLATSDMLSQAPPTREYFPSPILDKMTADESSGPTANGVCLMENVTRLGNVVLNQLRDELFVHLE